MELLGLRVRDAVTGFEGIVSSVGFDLYGCVQAVVTPPVRDGKPGDGMWFDTKRLIVLDKTPVLELPTFEVVPGGSEKPCFRPLALPR